MIIGVDKGVDISEVKNYANHPGFEFFFLNFPELIELIYTLRFGSIGKKSPSQKLSTELFYLLPDRTALDELRKGFKLLNPCAFFFITDLNVNQSLLLEKLTYIMTDELDVRQILEIISCSILDEQSFS